jgi:hypothetical protein
LSLLAATARAQSPTILDVAPIFSAYPVNYALLTDPKTSTQYVAYYNADRQITLASRSLSSHEWKIYTLPDAPAGQPPTKTAWDSHNALALALDSAGQLHLSGNYHAAPLLYYRTTSPGDITSLASLNKMVGAREASATYPRFLQGPNHELVFAYRDGRSGQGDDIYNLYHPDTQTWTRLLDQPLLDGEKKSNAYSVGPISGPDGFYHLTWVWRNSPDCSSNHDLSYARSKDLVHWENAAGKSLTLPITLSPDTIVDPVPVKGGMINNNTLIGFDPQHRPVLAYHKNTDEGTQLFLARFDNAANKWQLAQQSHWNYTWNFSGNGTMIFDIRVHPPETLPDGRFVATATHAKFGLVGFVVDPVTLQPTGPYTPPPLLPEALMKPESTFPGMTVNTVPDSGQSPDPRTRYLLRWETLPENRDQPRRGQLPPPTMLRLVTLPLLPQ